MVDCYIALEWGGYVFFPFDCILWVKGGSFSFCIVLFYFWSIFLSDVVFGFFPNAFTGGGKGGSSLHGVVRDYYLVR